MGVVSGRESVATSPDQTPDPVFGNRVVPDVQGRDVWVKEEIAYVEVLVEDLERGVPADLPFDVAIKQILRRVRAIAGYLGA